VNAEEEWRRRGDESAGKMSVQVNHFSSTPLLLYSSTPLLTDNKVQ
jgi:hypothetical protein